MSYAQKLITPRDTLFKVPIKELTKVKSKIVYPDSDGKPMSDNTEQFKWITKIKDGLDILYSKNPNVFVAGDLLWYPVEGEPKIRIAPDALVALGRPKGYRGSYRQWVENGIAPQVVFEILSPGNTNKEMGKKFLFYQKYQVEEYYLYDPESVELEGWIRHRKKLQPIANTHDWISPKLGIQFKTGGKELEIINPDGSRFIGSIERENQKIEEKLRADKEKLRADKEKLRADKEKLRANEEKLRAEKAEQEVRKEKLRADRMAKRLISLGISLE